MWGKLWATRWLGFGACVLDPSPRIGDSYSKQTLSPQGGRILSVALGFRIELVMGECWAGIGLVVDDHVVRIVLDPPSPPERVFGCFV